MPDEKELTAEESLKIINKMINATKRQFRDSGFIYLLWGWLLMVTSLAQFVLLHLEYYDISYYPYFLMPLGGIFTFIYFARKEKKDRVKSPVDNILSALWIYIGLNLFILPMCLSGSLKVNIIPVILVLLGCGTVMSGVIMRFRPLIIGGIVTNILAIGSTFLGMYAGWQWAILTFPAAALAADLIPGYILRAKYRKEDV